MAKEQFNAARSSRFFKPWDIAAYILIIIIIAAALIPTLIKSDGEISGLSVTYSGNNAAEYTFDGGLTDFKADGIAFAVTRDGELTYIAITTEKGYNKIKIDTNNKTVTMEEANCSKKADCKHMKISSSSDSIICLPHSLVILPITSDKLPGDVLI